MPDCYCKREYLDPSVRRMRSNDGIVHGVNGCFSSGETGVGGRSWEKRALDAEEKVQRVRAVADAWEYYASENGNVRTAWAASSVREALDGDA